METKLTGDLIISGSGRSTGGQFNVVDISGSGRVKGDIECVTYKVSGSSKIEGDVRTETLRISGSAHHYGNIVAESMEVSGSGRIDGHVAAKHLNVSGSVKVGKHLTGEEIDVSGSLKIHESCATERFKVKGSFEIGGLLNADVIDASLYHDSSAKEIGGGTIRIERHHKGFSLMKLFSGFNHFLTTEMIEGDNIALEYTRAKVVRGNDVRIGEGCEIDLVEYTGEFQQDSNAKVKEFKKI